MGFKFLLLHPPAVTRESYCVGVSFPICEVGTPTHVSWGSREDGMSSGEQSTQSPARNGTTTLRATSTATTATIICFKWYLTFLKRKNPVIYNCFFTAPPRLYKLPSVFHCVSAHRVFTPFTVMSYRTPAQSQTPSGYWKGPNGRTG